MLLQVPMDEVIVAGYYIDMFYRQALIWVSIPYVPMITLYAIVSQLIMFEVGMLSYSRWYTAADRPFEDSTGVGMLILMLTTVVERG